MIGNIITILLILVALVGIVGTAYHQISDRWTITFSDGTVNHNCRISAGWGGDDITCGEEKMYKVTNYRRVLE